MQMMTTMKSEKNNVRIGFKESQVMCVYKCFVNSEKNSVVNASRSNQVNTIITILYMIKIGKTATKCYGES